MSDAKTGERNKRFLWRCRGCRRQFTVRIGTVLEESRIPLRHWCYAFWKACSSKKGVSALQMSRETGLSYKSALFMMHRVRYAMADDHEMPSKLSGVVEVDETYVGGKPRYKGQSKRGRGTKKAPVVALVERGGETTASARCWRSGRRTGSGFATASQPEKEPFSRSSLRPRILRAARPSGPRAARQPSGPVRGTG